MELRPFHTELNPSHSRAAGQCTARRSDMGRVSQKVTAARPLPADC